MGGVDFLKPIQEQKQKNVKRFRGGLVLQAYRILHHQLLGLGVKKKKKKKKSYAFV